MDAPYHRQMTASLRDRLRPIILNRIADANVAQDRPAGWFHPEYHFDNNLLAESWDYVNQQLDQAATGLRRENPAGWSALGRALHAAQDFYAHSNYVYLWLAGHGGPAVAEVADIPAWAAGMYEGRLYSGHFRFWRYLLCRMPGGRALARRMASYPYSHEEMNLDRPERGPEFPFAIAAATRHTRQVVDALLADLPHNDFIAACQIEREDARRGNPSLL